MYARVKMPWHKVWQYIDAPLVDLPLWVSNCTEMHGDGLYLVRASGKQRIESSEWLVQDSPVLWLTDAEFQAEYELDVQPPAAPEAA